MAIDLTASTSSYTCNAFLREASSETTFKHRRRLRRRVKDKKTAAIPKRRMRQEKRNAILPDFYATDAMMDRSRISPNNNMRSSVTRLASQGFHLKYGLHIYYEQSRQAIKACRRNMTVGETGQMAQAPVSNKRQCGRGTDGRHKMRNKRVLGVINHREQVRGFQNAAYSFVYKTGSLEWPMGRWTGITAKNGVLCCAASTAFTLQVPHESVSKRRQMESQKIEAKEVCDRIIQETTHRFQSLRIIQRRLDNEMTSMAQASNQNGKNMEGVIVGGRRIKCIRFVDDMALLAEEEMILKDMLLELNDTCEQHGMKINANKTKSMVIGRKIQKINLRILNGTVEQVDSFKYLGCTISSNMSCCQEVKRRIAMAKEAFNREKSIFCGPLEKELRKRLVKSFIWSVALYGAETWTLRRSEEKRIEAFEMLIWRRMERVKWTERVRNEAVLKRVGEERMILKLIKKNVMLCFI
ncbi:hypothetical protein ANN_14547 [Periplaneta americana]|uniref:Reverse transcriptase domain-containing protein n=1 Tax=Periplaneta americana TaxID=6978 RepID=A0ABQ8SYQ8_PERAM|nr:hypothetical protein ANN_14547 [Periplaneta americana]